MLLLRTTIVLTVSKEEDAPTIVALQGVEESTDTTEPKNMSVDDLQEALVKMLMYISQYRSVEEENDVEEPTTGGC